MYKCYPKTKAVLSKAFNKTINEFSSFEEAYLLHTFIELGDWEPMTFFLR